MEEAIAHPVVTLEMIDSVLDFIKKNMNTLADGDDREGFADRLENMNRAKELVGDDNMRATCLIDAAIQYANQLAFRLFVEDRLSESMLAEFRELPAMKDVTKWAKDYTAETRARADEITRMQQEYMDERKPFEIFQAVIGGMTKEEAERKQAEYEAQKAQALGAR